MKPGNRHKKIEIRSIINGLLFAIILASAGRVRGDSWTQKSDMPTPRFNHSAAVVNGKIYIIGGVASEPSFLNGKELSAVEEYDPATDTWTRKADMPVARGYLTKSNPVLDGKIYVIGGGKSGSSRVDVYDPAMDTWTRGADMPTPRALLATVAWNGKIYAFGGLSTLEVPVNSLQALNIAEVYDPKTNTWTQAAPMPQGVWEHSADVIDGNIYVVGGAHNVNAMRILQVYDPQTDSWTEATPAPLSARGFGATVICDNIYVMGGWLNSGQRPYLDAWVYDQTTDTWTQADPLPDFRAELTTSAVNGRIYAIGGTPRQHNCQATSTVYELELEMSSPSPDFNGDGVVDDADVTIMVECWHRDEHSCDIAPEPCGDGIVDVSDMVALIEHLGQNLDDPTLIAHWALDELEGNVALDSVADNNGQSDGLVVGDPFWLPTGGRVGGAIALDGADDYIIIGPVLNPSDGPFSVIVWIKGGAPGQAIISEPGGSNWLSTDPVDGHLMTELAGGGRSSGPLLSDTIVTDVSWHRIGLVWDGWHRILYVDGVMVAQDTQDSLNSLGTGMYIGTGNAMAPESFWSGLIDDVRIYNRAIKP
ncbi:MAG: kelch repeat-containing protein [Sedimentisphaerales bacterium]|jgi:N-acetylneuraminic acid mutarotase